MILKFIHLLTHHSIAFLWDLHNSPLQIPLREVIFHCQFCVHCSEDLWHWVYFHTIAQLVYLEKSIQLCFLICQSSSSVVIQTFLINFLCYIFLKYRYRVNFLGCFLFYLSFQICQSLIFLTLHLLFVLYPRSLHHRQYLEVFLLCFRNFVVLYITIDL